MPVVHLSEGAAKEAQSLLEQALYELKKVIVGQEYLLERLIQAILCGGHVLVEGPPGLAKTLALKTLSEVMDVEFKRIQFTPDLLPSDLIGTRIYNPANGSFSTEQGPLFANFVLADEINRAPAKVQSALLEAMQETQVTIGKETFPLKAPFLVMATQNPLELEGTYPLPEAQLDRFLFKLLVSYPDLNEEVVIIQRMTDEVKPALSKTLNSDRIHQLQQSCHQVYLDPKLMHYIAQLVQATRSLATEEKAHLQYGASPRGSLALATASKAVALMRGRHYVTPDDIATLVNDCLRHRVILSYEAHVAGRTADHILNQIKQTLSVPQLTTQT